MRLLNIKTLKLEFFLDPPEYAILSHTWGEEEVLFQDVENGTQESKKGWEKVKHFCLRAAEDGFEYGWVDTCCIDKRDGSELSEAINSMFKWYKQAAVCYAYLQDVVEDTLQEWFDCRWFKRGWTLQELLAPMHVILLDSSWISIGTKVTRAQEISRVTGIGLKYLENFRSGDIATKMSWAAKRETTRQEDTAYCLLGLFDIAMPLLYGEGDRAFLRLQLELIKQTNDESIFAHSSNPDSDLDTGWLSDLDSAPQPMINRQHLSANYFSSRSLFLSDPAQLHLGHLTYFDKERPDFAMTNRGLVFQPIAFALDFRDGGGEEEEGPDYHLSVQDAPESDIIAKDIIVPLNYGPDTGGYYALKLRADGSAPDVYRKTALCVAFHSGLNKLEYLGRVRIYIKDVAPPAKSDYSCFVKFQIDSGVIQGPIERLGRSEHFSATPQVFYHVEMPSYCISTILDVRRFCLPGTPSLLLLVLEKPSHDSICAWLIDPIRIKTHKKRGELSDAILNDSTFHTVKVTTEAIEIVVSVHPCSSTEIFNKLQAATRTVLRPHRCFTVVVTARQTPPYRSLFLRRDQIIYE